MVKETSNLIGNYGNYGEGGKAAIAARDFNNDGYVDCIIAVNRSLYLHLHNHSPECYDSSPGIYLGEVPTPPWILTGPKQPAVSLAPLDYNNDGYLDFLCSSDDCIYLFTNKGNCTFDNFFICELPAVLPSDENSDKKCWPDIPIAYAEQPLSSHTHGF